MPSNSTPYDDAFRTLLNDCKSLILPVLNEAFGEHYTGRERIEFLPNEHFLNREDGNEEKRITDSCFEVTDSKGNKKKYHVESQSTPDSTMLVRMFEYDTQIALDDGEVMGSTLTVTFPHSAVLFLRSTRETPEEMTIRMIVPSGELSYTIPVVKMQRYSLEKILAKKLYFLLPFYIFTHESRFRQYEQDAGQLEHLLAEYAEIQGTLEQLQETGQMDALARQAIIDMTKRVAEHIACRFEKVQEGVKTVMGGQILEYEAKTIWREGRDEGISIGRDEGIRIGRDEGFSIGLDKGRDAGRNEERKKAVAETEERAKDMIRDRMELSLVEKYTHLPLPRIRELAHGLGML